MKKIFVIFSAVLLMLLLVSCGGGESLEGPLILPPQTTFNPTHPTSTEESGEVRESGTESAPNRQESTPEPPSSATPPASVVNMTDDFIITTATQMTENIRVGWNSGNTLDAWGDEQGWAWLGGGRYENTTVRQMETAWVGQVATQELINAVYEAGFNTLRIPVTWFKAATDENLTIREDWLSRVHEIVGYAVANDMYIILNTHHDETLFRFLDRYHEQSLADFRRIWEQIAYAFRDYDHRLIFQGLNEPRTRGSSAEWSGGTPEERANINIFNQVFVDIVRESGGNNAERVLMITTHAASSLPAAQRALEMPADTVDDRIIVNLHIYSPYEFALHRGSARARDDWDANLTRDTNPVTEPLNLAHQLFVSQGVPVMLTEFGALYRGNNAARAAWVEFFAGHAASLGIPVVWWDNGEYWETAVASWGGWYETFGLFCRRSYEVMHPEVLDALMRAVD